MSSPEGISGTNSVPPVGQAFTRPARQAADQVSTDSAANLRSALANLPEIRPEVVARASALAADPGYPSLSIIRSIASQILAAPDLSESDA
jgi:hypothetical protein